MNAAGLELRGIRTALELPPLAIVCLAQDPAPGCKGAGLQVSRNTAKQNISAKFYSYHYNEGQTAGNPGCPLGLQPGFSNAWFRLSNHEDIRLYYWRWQSGVEKTASNSSHARAPVSKRASASPWQTPLQRLHYPLTANPTWDDFYLQHATSNHLKPHFALRLLTPERRSHSAVCEIHAEESLLISDQSLLEIQLFQKLLHSHSGKYLSSPGKLHT